MAPARNQFFEIHDTVKGLIFEAWASSEKEALQFGRFRVWAQDKSHVGLRRILRPSDPWPVLVEEANYFTAQRVGTEKKRAYEESLRQIAIQSEEERLTRKAAEETADAQRLEAVRTDQVARSERRQAIDARLARHRPIFNLPTYDSLTNEWV